MRDGASLGMLREMLVMIRIWGLLKPGCLPTFTAMSDNQDSMQLLFRLLTKLWLCCKTRHRNTTPSATPGAACHSDMYDCHMEGRWCVQSRWGKQSFSGVMSHFT